MKANVITSNAQFRKKPLGYVESVNFINKHGIETFKEFLRTLQSGSNAEAGKLFGVTRERVRQLKNLMFHEFVSVTPNNGVLLALRHNGHELDDQVVREPAHDWLRIDGKVSFIRCLDCGLELQHENLHEEDKAHILKSECPGLPQMTLGDLLSLVNKYKFKPMQIELSPELTRRIIHDARMAHKEPIKTKTKRKNTKSINTEGDENANS